MTAPKVWQTQFIK